MTSVYFVFETNSWDVVKLVGEGALTGGVVCHWEDLSSSLAHTGIGRANKAGLSE